MNNCNHTQWVENSNWIDGEWDDDGTWIDGSWEESEVITTIDLDLHRYKCTQCGKIMYYSTTAKEYFEDGKIANIKGLDK